MKIVGILLIGFGLVDLIGSYTGFDLWGDFLKIQLPEVVWRFSSWIEIGLGYFLMNLGSGSDDYEAESSGGEESSGE